MLKQYILESSAEKPFLVSIRGKLLAAFLFTGLAIILALGVTYFSFRGLLNTVDQLASPNEKLKTLHQFFQNVAQLDQRQRAEAIQNPGKPYADFLKESKTLLLMIDTLQAMDWKDPHQVERLHAMEEILLRRDKLFFSYLRFRSGFIVNKKFSEKLDSLSAILANAKIWTDSNITTTQRKTTTTTFLPSLESGKTKDKGLFSRLFKKKEDKALGAKIEVKEELSVKIDTLSIAQRDSAMLAVDHVMKNLDQNQRLQSKYMLQHELELINANTILINQLLNILHETEEEELSLMHVNNEAAAQLVNKSIRRIGIIMIVFFTGGALLVFLILTDITRTNYYRLQLMKAKEEAENLSQVKQRFLANMSHEIRTPLQSILGYSEQLKKEKSANTEALQAIHNSSEHLLHIVNEILDYSRIESGKFTLEHEPFSILQIIEEVSSVMQVQAEKRGLIFLFDTENAADAVVLGDAFRLRQILFNILGNAIKFTPHGTVKLTVQIQDAGQQVHCQFSVTDTGIGMHSKDIDRVFQQFEQANASISRQYGGAGLGLTIVKTLVEAQHGKLHIESEPSKGTSVNVDLTFEKATLAPAENLISKPVTNNRAKGKVLVVDDDPLILRLCSLILEKNHIPYTSFQESEKVLEEKLDDINLVLLDIRMPGVNGLDLCRALRKKLNKKTRIIALTAHVLPQEKEDLLKNGFDDVLTKPFRENSLLELIDVSPGETPTETSVMATTIDLSALKKMTMGDDLLLQSVISQFVEETEGDIVDLDKHIANLNDGSVREIIHKLAGRTGQMGMQDLCRQLKIMETDLNSGKKVSSMVENILNMRNSIEDALREVKKKFLKDVETTNHSSVDKESC